MGRIFMKSCEVCGKRFDTGRSDAIYCSNACTQKAYRKRKNADREAKRKTLDLWSYAVLKQVETDAPALEPMINEFFAEHQKDALTDLLRIMDVYRKAVLHP